MLKEILATQHFAGKRLDAALEGFCQTVDVSFLVSEQRLIKSPAEPTYVRCAGELADAAWQGGCFDDRRRCG